METTTEQTETSTFLKIIERIHKTFVNGIRNGGAIAPKRWLADRKLSIEVTGACYNSGQIHHRKPQEFKDELESIGFLKPSNVPTNAGQRAYNVFGSYSILFPLRDEDHRVVNYYAVGIENGKRAFMNEQGIYPAYPNPYIKKLYIVNTIIEAATLLESKTLKENEAVIALFDGEIMPQHNKMIETLKELEEVVILDSKKIKS